MYKEDCSADTKDTNCQVTDEISGYRGKDNQNMVTQIESVLIKSKNRVRMHGEVFTPQWVVDMMINIPRIKEKTEDVFATFLEPSAGEGVFLLAIESLKLQFVTDNYSTDTWNAYALWALSSIYGIEFLEDNLTVARENMLMLFSNYYKGVHNKPLSKQNNIYKSAQAIIWANVVQGNTLTCKNQYSEEITFSHWSRIPGDFGKVQRIPFTYSSLFDSERYEKINMKDCLLGTDEQVGHNHISSLQCAIVDIEQVWKEGKSECLTHLSSM